MSENRMIQKEELFHNQRLTMEVAFDTIANTTIHNQSRILVLEETLLRHQDEIEELSKALTSMEEECVKKEEEWRKQLNRQEIEVRKLHIILDTLVPQKIECLEHRVIDLEDRVELLHEIIRCKDQVIASMSV